jgi:hypothetical protein
MSILPAHGDQDGEVYRLLGLGATVVDDRRELTPVGWIVVADPERTNSASRSCSTAADLDLGFRTFAGRSSRPGHVDGRGEPECVAGRGWVTVPLRGEALRLP